MNGPRSSPNLGLDDSPAALRAALYMRVSTGRQAEHDLSIPDQRSQLKSWCRANGHHVVAECLEAGASAGDDRRPAFQQMIERACDGEHVFDIIVVHSYSRFSAKLSSRNSTCGSLRNMASGSFLLLSLWVTKPNRSTQ
jgi:DNA invertase Pin-like site-specific DNA recombinase